MQQLKDREDDALIKICLKGDKRAYEILVVRYQSLVFNVVIKLVKSREWAADVTQETFIKAYKALPTFRTEANFKPWLLRIATNTALNTIKSQTTLASLDDLLEEMPSIEPKSEENIERNLESKMVQEKLVKVLDELKPLHRHLFLLRYQHDLTYEEIATVLDEPLTTIKSQLFRVKNKVRLLMANEFAELMN